MWPAAAPEHNPAAGYAGGGQEWLFPVSQRKCGTVRMPRFGIDFMEYAGTSAGLISIPFSGRVLAMCGGQIRLRAADQGSQFRHLGPCVSHTSTEIEQQRSGMRIMPQSSPTSAIPIHGKGAYSRVNSSSGPAI